MQAGPVGSEVKQPWTLHFGWGHQKSLCVTLSIYFTHHPSSGWGDPVTPDLGLPATPLWGIRFSAGLSVGAKVKLVHRNPQFLFVQRSEGRQQTPHGGGSVKKTLPTPPPVWLSVINQGAISGILELRCYQPYLIFTHTTVCLISTEITNPLWTRHAGFQQFVSLWNWGPL